MKNNVKGINHVGLTVPNIDQATEFFKNAFGAKIAYDGLSYDDDPRQGSEVERMLGLSQGSKIIKQRMIVIGNSANIEMFEIKSNSQSEPLRLEDLGFNHISLFVENMDQAINDAVEAGAMPLSEKHDNSKYEDSTNSSSVYLKTSWKLLIELQSIPNGYYYPKYSEQDVFIPKD
ncbi:VOC family protein [Staphylococcus sp. ACRSN]|uniref:VOC family protein n=1 Tax=Staphylococcus sp. ACRSN TaxID=2918214 RepID=UPI001EF2CBD0|nr:VOC family protein [Staphylococcus sp. ACRSN]MCG7339504.1 VOC family protein [Staphylococcus sp. ACRSN]